MPTLANLQGSSLVSQFGAPIAGGIDRLQGRRREAAATTELEDLLRGALGQAPLEREDQPSGEGLLAQLQQGGGLFGKIGQGGGTALPEQRPQQEGGLLGRLSPGLAQAINSARGNPEQEGQLREQVDSGAALSAELQALPNHAARVRRLAQEGGNLSARGEDIGRVTALSNLPPDQLDLELMKMEMIGKEATAQLPALDQQGSIAAVMARNPQLGAGLLQRRDQQIEAERRRKSAAANAAAAARRPQTDLGRGLAGIRADVASGAISQEVGDQMIANMRSGATAIDPAAAQAAATLNKTELGNQILQQEVDAAAGGPAFDPASPQGKLVGDRNQLVERFGEDSPLVTEFDRLTAATTTETDLAAELTVENIEATRLENQQAAIEAADPNSDLSAAEQQIQRIMTDQGTDRATAQSIVDGILRVTSDPITGETGIVNLVTKETIKPTSIGAELPSLLPAGITDPPEVPTGDPARLFGAQGFGINAVNTLTGAITGGSIDSATDEAKQALDNLNTRTMLALSGEFPGRPSNLTRERIEALSPQPASIFTGKARATTQLRQMSDMLAESIAGADRIARGQGNFTPADRGAAAKSVEQLLPIWDDYQAILGKLQGNTGQVSNIVNQAEFDALEKGAKFKLPDGTTGTK